MSGKPRQRRHRYKLDKKIFNSVPTEIKVMLLMAVCRV